MTPKPKAFFIAGGAIGAIALAAGAWWYLPVYRAQQTVRLSLKDPESARFEQVVFFRATGGACGFVNAKNGMGGYVGFRHFTLDKEGHVQFAPDEARAGASSMEKFAAASANLDYLRTAITICPDDPDQAESRSANDKAASKLDFPPPGDLWANQPEAVRDIVSGTASKK